MIFLANDEMDMHIALLAASEKLSAQPASSLKSQASSLGESALAEEERLARIHCQWVDE